MDAPDDTTGVWLACGHRAGDTDGIVDLRRVTAVRCEACRRDEQPAVVIVSRPADG